MLIKGQRPGKECYPFFRGLQTTLEAETRTFIQYLLYGSHQLIAQVMKSTTEERNSSRVDSVSTVVETQCCEGQCGCRQVGGRDGTG